MDWQTLIAVTGIVSAASGGLATLIWASGRETSRAIRGLEQRVAENLDDHQRMWDRIDQHSVLLANHAARLHAINGGGTASPATKGP